MTLRTAVGMTLLALGHGVVSAALPSGHTAARDAWDAAGLENYQYSYHKYCDCYGDSPPETLVTIESGTVADVRHKRASGRIVPAEPQNFGYYWSVDEMFQLIERAAEHAGTITVEYDATLGFPRRLYIDYLPARVGDEVDIRILTLTAEPQ